MGMKYLPDIYAQSLRTSDLMTEGMYISGKLQALVTGNMYNFWQSKNHPYLQFIVRFLYRNK